MERGKPRGITSTIYNFPHAHKEQCNLRGESKQGGMQSTMHAGILCYSLRTCAYALVKYHFSQNMISVAWCLR